MAKKQVRKKKPAVDYAAKIEELRRNLGKYQFHRMHLNQQLAEKLGISESKLSRIKSGNSGIPLELFLKICDELGKDLTTAFEPVQGNRWY